jgi:hypothetical protein
LRRGGCGDIEPLITLLYGACPEAHAALVFARKRTVGEDGPHTLGVDGELKSGALVTEPGVVVLLKWPLGFSGEVATCRALPCDGVADVGRFRCDGLGALVGGFWAGEVQGRRCRSGHACDQTGSSQSRVAGLHRKLLGLVVGCISDVKDLSSSTQKSRVPHFLRPYGLRGSALVGPEGGHR